MPPTDLIWLAAAVLLFAFGLAAVVWWAGSGRPVLPAEQPPPRAVAALQPDDPTLPVDLTSQFWQANPSEPLKPSEIVRWRNITSRYEVVER